MKTPDDESVDELARAYQRASDAQAGDPSASTRAAILAEARAAALRRTPSANESRYVWRAVAGIAVLGVAVMLWRQADRLTPDLTVATPERTAVPQPPAPAPMPAAATQSAPVKEEREAQSTPKATPPTVQLARASADAVAPAQAAGAMRKDSLDYQQLLQREFPEVWNDNEPPHTVWVVTDAQGNVLRKGSMPPGAAITTDQPFESQRPWTMVSVKTASGTVVQLAVMTIN